MHAKNHTGNMDEDTTMRNHARPTPAPVTQRGAACAAFEEILPVLDEPAANQRLVASARAHLATCAYCQGQFARYVHLDATLRRSYAPGVMPALRLEEVTGATPMYRVPAHREDWKTMEPESAFSQEFQVSSLPQTSALGEIPAAASRLATKRLRRRWISALTTVAAALVIGALTLTLLATQHYFRSSPASPQRNSALLPMDASQTLASFSMLSANDGWALEVESPVITGHTLDTSHVKLTLLHYHDGRWAPVQNISTTNIGQCIGDQSISMDSPTDGWVSAQLQPSQLTLPSAMLYYNGHTWQKASTPAGYQMCGVKMVSPTSGWAFGNKLNSDGSPNPAILSYDGHAWRAQPIDTPLPQAYCTGGSAPYEITSLAAVSPTDAWAVATRGSCSSTPDTSVILRYHNGVWEQQNIFQQITMWGLSFDTANDGWAIGMRSTQAGQSDDLAVLLHYHAGHWTILSHPDVPYILAVGPIVAISSTNVWALGIGITAGDNRDQILLHYDGKRWHDILQPQVSGRASLDFGALSVVGSDVWVGGSATWPDTRSYPTYPFVGGGGSYPAQFPMTTLILGYHNGVWQTLLS